METQKPADSPQEFFRVGLALLLVALDIPALSFVMLSLKNIRHSREARIQDQCRRNFIETGTAVEAYAADHHGSLPSSLGQICPHYRQSIPKCPASQQFPGYIYSQQTSNYTIMCSGLNHRYWGTPHNFPQYSGLQGLQDSR